MAFNSADIGAFKNVWVFCEQRQGKMMPTTFELISEGRKLADELGVDLCGILLGDNVDGIAAELGNYGADKVYVYMAMLLPANALGEKYDELGIDRSVLSRTCEDGGTLVCPMVPWGSSGVYTAATLGVATMSYMPYYLMGFINPIFVIICAVTGFGIKKADPERLAELKAERDALMHKG